MQRSAVRTLRLLAMLLAAVALLIPATAAAHSHGKRQHPKRHHHARHDGRDHQGGQAAPDALYTTTNSPSGNAVIAYTRHADGTLTQTGAPVPTGGKGAASEPPFGFPIVDSSGSTNITPDGKLLFVVNAGNNTISSFRTTSAGPVLVDNVSSGGTLPISLTSHGNLLYVVNEISANITGWSFSSSGHLTPIPGSTESLSTPFDPTNPPDPTRPTGVAAAIGFAPDGHQLVVTIRGLPAPNGVIDTFSVDWHGAAEPAVKHQAPTPNPFGFSFAGQNNLLVSDAGFVATPSGTAADPGGSPPLPADPSQFFGSAASFSLSPSGGLKFKGDYPDGGRAACWLVVSKDQRYAFVSNTLASPAGSPAGIGSGKGAISTFAISPHGRLTLVSQTDASPFGDPLQGGFPGDEALSSDGKFLYVLNPAIIFAPKPSHIDVYRVGPGGTLTHIQEVHDAILPNSVSGLGVN
ncbi:MAG: lactonase family protein [Solirubrobacteraceae bacterium]